MDNIDKDEGGYSPTLMQDGRKPHDPPFTLCAMVENLMIRHLCRIK